MVKIPDMPILNAIGTPMISNIMKLNTRTKTPKNSIAVISFC